MIKIIYGLQFLYLVYAVAIFSSYLILALISYFEMRRYMTKNSFADYKMILSSPLAPSISLVAPAYNEGLTIIENVKSLMSIEYNNYDIIIVNDGSKDDSLEKMQQAFDLKKVDFLIDRTLPCNDIRA
ncbi:MAG: glycosyltransferase family 2 protein, partial [Imperialibacter sp.]